MTYTVIFEMLEVLHDVVPRLHSILIDEHGCQEGRTDALTRLTQQLQNDSPGCTVYPLFKHHVSGSSSLMLNPLGVLESFAAIESKLYSKAMAKVRDDLSYDLSAGESFLRPNHRERRIHDLFSKQREKFV